MRGVKAALVAAAVAGALVVGVALGDSSEARSLIVQALALWDTSKRIPTLTQTDLDAKGLLERVVAEYPNTEEAAEALRHLAFGHYYKGQAQEALAYWNRLFTEYPDSPQCAVAWLDKAEYHFKLGDYATAAECCTNIMTKFAATDDGREALIERAFCKQAAQDFQGAADDLKQAAESDPSPERQAKAFYWLGYSHFRLARYGDARTALERILGDSSAPFAWWHDNARFLRAHCFYSEGDKANALTALREVVAQNQDEAGPVCAEAMIKDLTASVHGGVAQ